MTVAGLDSLERSDGGHGQRQRRSRAVQSAAGECAGGASAARSMSMRRWPERFNAPTVKGAVQLHKGTIHDYRHGIDLTEIEGTLEGTQSELRITQLTAHAATGTCRGHRHAGVSAGRLAGGSAFHGTQCAALLQQYRLRHCRMPISPCRAPRCMNSRSPARSVSIAPRSKFRTAFRPMSRYWMCGARAAGGSTDRRIRTGLQSEGDGECAAADPGEGSRPGCGTGRQPGNRRHRAGAARGWRL